MRYNHRQIERKWQRIWEKTKIYQTPDRVRGKKNFYHLVMFPYPSGDLHMGHWFNFAPADVYARFKKRQGFNLLSPIGFDAFGLPAENAALKHGIHPKKWTYRNIARMRKQLRSMGPLYDWDREIITCDPLYYRWTQWMFLQLYKAGLCYRAKVPANFCPSCKTILANEQVIEGRCERCNSLVLQKEIEQWLFKITALAQDLLSGLENIDWPEETKLMQKNWIGKSEGAIVYFPILNSKKVIPVFTTRADTLFGATYLVLAPEHPLLEELKPQILNLKSVEKYIEQSRKKTERERISELKEKTGIKLKGIFAQNPVNARKIPIFVADYVLPHYGTGAIMAVPAHDQRDFDFAKKYNLPIIEVIKPSFQPLPQKAALFEQKPQDRAYQGEGILINSGRFTGMESELAKKRIVEWLKRKNLAQFSTCFKLRDWVISRQRYWGAPIPMVFCQNCGWQPVKEKDLPVLLPPLKDFHPAPGGKSPLARSKKFVQTFCPRCHGPAQRETDTMDTFVCSSWYFLRYTDPRNEKKFARKSKLRAWLPVRVYIGGREHAVLHLLYARFFTKVLNKLGYLFFDEPFLSLRHQGVILGPDGYKMSKSRGNVIEPGEQIKNFGADSLRVYLCFMGPYDQGGPWNPQGIVGVRRFLDRVFSLYQIKKRKKEKKDKNLEKLLHQTIKKVTEDLENFRFNTAVSALMILVNQMATNFPTKDQLKTLLLLLAPFAPHLTEELWQKHYLSSAFSPQRSIHNQPWPKYDPRLVKEEKIILIVQVNGKVRDRIESRADLSKKEALSLALSSKKVQKWIEGKKPKKVIFVKGKLINLVI